MEHGMSCELGSFDSGWQLHVFLTSQECSKSRKMSLGGFVPKIGRGVVL